MSVKFRIGLTIDGETLLRFMANVLPIEDVSVEEISLKPTLRERTIAVHTLTERAIAHHKPKRKGVIRLKSGINGIILAAMAKEPMRALELKPLIQAAGYSESSVASRLEFLQEKGIIERIGDGRWRVVSKS